MEMILMFVMSPIRRVGIGLDEFDYLDKLSELSKVEWVGWVGKYSDVCGAVIIGRAGIDSMRVKLYLYFCIYICIWFVFVFHLSVAPALSVKLSSSKPLPVQPVNYICQQIQNTNTNTNTTYVNKYKRHSRAICPTREAATVANSNNVCIVSESESYFDLFNIWLLVFFKWWRDFSHPMFSHTKEFQCAWGIKKPKIMAPNPTWAHIAALLASELQYSSIPVFQLLASEPVPDGYPITDLTR